MPLGGDLGFSYLVLVGLLVGPAIAFLVLRRKWRRSVARREEIKRLLVLASEEAARAELEASSTYVTSAEAAAVEVSRPLQYQCAVCFCPTTTRCARCKAVRYCSGKCQIVHWRQGHKEECRPFIISHQLNDLGGSFSQKVVKQDEDEIYGGSFETEGRQSAKSVQNLPEEPACSKSNSSPKVFSGNDNCEVQYLSDGERTNSGSHETVRPDGHQSANIFPDKLETNWVNNMDQNGPPSSKLIPSVGSVDYLSSSDVRSSDATTVISDGAHPTTLEIKKPIDRPTLAKEIHDHAAKGRNSPLSIPEKSSCVDVYTNDSPASKSGEPRYSSSSSYAYPSAGGPPRSIRPPNVDSIRSLSLERSNHVVNGMSTTSHPLQSKEGGSLSSSASVAHLSSSTRRHSFQSAKCEKDDSAPAVAASSSEFGSYSPNARNGLKTSMWKVVDQLRASKSSRHYQPGVGSESVGRYNTKGLFPYELFVKLYNWNKIELRPCGLTNCGNSCYANAVLQCLACTPPLTAYLVQGLHSKACGRKEWCFTCEFESLILKAKERSSPLSPIGILSQIQKNGSHLGNGREEDAHEFLRYAIDTMQSVCLKEAGVNASGSMEEETTLIGLTFGGYLRSKIKCMKCGGKSERHEMMMDLTVEIEGDIGTLEEALRKYTGTEILDGENKYDCSSCRSYERAKKKLTILEAPNILTIALKRFQTGKFGKLSKAIKFPEILDLAPYLSGTSDKSPIYRLYGVVVHLDIMNAAFSGHYVCYVKTIQNKWFKIDDSTVKAVDLESVLTKGAYMLLYARCSPRSPRLIRNSIIPKNHAFKSRSHPTSPWEASRGDSLNDQTVAEHLYPNRASIPPIRTILEEDSSSDNSSSIFSEGGSCSTESTKWDSTSNDDLFDSFFGDLGRYQNSQWRNSSDSDSSSSSPSSSPSLLYSRNSRLSHSDRYPETNASQIQNAESGTDDQGFWGRILGESGNWEGKSSVSILDSDKSKQCRKLASSSSSSSSCRETNSGSRLGCANPFNKKESGVSFSRSTRERTD